MPRQAHGAYAEQAEAYAAVFAVVRIEQPRLRWTVLIVASSCACSSESDIPPLLAGLANRCGALMSHTYLFLDTEWADWEGRELVSLALVNHRTGATFYAERDPLPDNPTEFVREVVYPLLDRGEFVLCDLQFTRALRAFLAEAPAPVVLYDYPNDGALFLSALSGFQLLPSELADCVAPPANLRSTLLQDDRVSQALEDYFAERSSERARRHHALVDARALHAAWLSAGQLPGSIA